jgi:hypothetical protein
LDVVYRRRERWQGPTRAARRASPPMRSGRAWGGSNRRAKHWLLADLTQKTRSLVNLLVGSSDKRIIARGGSWNLSDDIRFQKEHLEATCCERSNLIEEIQETIERAKELIKRIDETLARSAQLTHLCQLMSASAISAAHRSGSAAYAIRSNSSAHRRR